MHQYFAKILQHYFSILDQFGMPGVGVLLAMCLPGEVLVPPAAYLEAYRVAKGPGDAILNTVILVLICAVGYTIGCILIYWVARGIGRPLVLRYGKYVLVTEKKLKVAEAWMDRFGAGGIIFGTLIPGVRHAICIPAGITGMRFRTYVIAVFLGATLWCAILAVFGLVMSKQMAMVTTTGNLESPEVRQAMLTLTLATVGLVIVIAALYVVATRRSPAPASDTTEATTVD